MSVKYSTYLLTYLHLAVAATEDYDAEDDTKNLRGDVYQANASIVRAYSLVSLLEKREKNGLTPVIWDSLT